MNALAQLLSSVRINKLELKNRAVMPPMGTGYGNTDGTVSDQLMSYLTRRAGGAGLIITEVCAVDPRGKGFDNEIGVWSDTFIERLSELTEAVHRKGSCIALQLHHAGRETFAAFAGAPPEAPSPIPSVVLNQPCEEMSRDRIREVIAAYAQGARRAEEAGFDAVEVHGAHGYLIGQFLSPFSNQRTDEFGGSDENRARFAIEIIKAIRSEIPADFPVIFRLSAEELVRGGYTLDFSSWLAPQLVTAGADALHVSVGVYSTPGNLSIPSMDTEAGFNLFRARAIKELVDVPVIGVGRITDPRMGNVALSRGDADLISFGRQHLADPDFIEKATRGDFDSIRWCLGCNGCIERLSFELKPVTCVINPECGFEYLGGIQRAEPGKRLWIVGAGPAGLTAAFTAAERGHTVEIFDCDAEPGGQMKPASKPPHKEPFREWIDWIVHQLDRCGISVQTKEITEDALRVGKPDAVIIATGALPITPDIPGIDSTIVCDARDLLMGEREPQGPVAVLGAGYVGMETADFLVAHGIEVSLIDMKPSTPVGRIAAHGYWLHKRLRNAGASLILGATVSRIENRTVIYEQDGEEKTLGPVALIVTALGARSERDLIEPLEKIGIPSQVIGDAQKPGRLIDAIHDGYRAAREI
jgi:2,4-dienoyl-CoA reductase-like NADH-dependent reductase (Old Yellow Enzyme family)/thioredoxin reductase